MPIFCPYSFKPALSYAFTVAAPTICLQVPCLLPFSVGFFGFRFYCTVRSTINILVTVLSRMALSKDFYNCVTATSLY